MQAQINLLRATVEDANATGEEYAAVYYSAKEAKENLVLADRNTSNNKGSGSTSANIGNAYGAAGVVAAGQNVDEPARRAQFPTRPWTSRSREAAHTASR